MRFMLLVKGSKEAEEGTLPDVQLFADMTKYNNDLKASGALLALDGLQSSSKGARITFTNGAQMVTDGPFPNPEELVEGYWVIQVGSKDEAIEWAKRVPFKDGVVEVRQIQEISDFPPEIQQAVGQ